MLLWPELKDRLYNRLNHNTFDEFCSFTVSNGSNFMRNGMFNQLKHYKHVCSYGKYKTNDFALQKATNGVYWRDAKDKFFLEHKHKFSIAYENSPYPGYTTEKLMDSFLAGSIPIYWGSPNIHKEFNEKAFINVIKYSDIIKTIKEFDQNREKFLEMYNEPVFTDTQKDKLENNLGEFETWLLKIIK
jgi:hypothetical protein